MKNLLDKPIPAKGMFASTNLLQALSDEGWELIEQELTKLSKDCEDHILREWEESQEENY